MKKVTCYECHGEPISSMGQCRTCGGKGYIIVPEKEEMPKSVSIVAMGTSSLDFTLGAMPFGHIGTTEVWAINFAGGVIQCDKIFLMDDLRMSQQRCEGVPKAWEFHERIKHMGIPIITTQHYPEWPTSEPFPLPEVINHVGVPYMNNTVAYCVGYALWQDFKEIYIYGGDFTYPNSHVGERGRGNVEMLLGIAKERGVKVMVARNSNLMDSNVPIPERFYGYKNPPQVVSVGTDGKKTWQWHNELLFKKFEPVDIAPCNLCQARGKVQYGTEVKACHKCHGTCKMYAKKPTHNPLVFRKIAA